MLLYILLNSVLIQLTALPPISDLSLTPLVFVKFLLVVFNFSKYLPHLFPPGAIGMPTHNASPSKLDPSPAFGKYVTSCDRAVSQELGLVGMLWVTSFRRRNQ